MEARLKSGGNRVVSTQENSGCMRLLQTGSHQRGTGKESGIFSRENAVPDGSVHKIERAL